MLPPSLQIIITTTTSLTIFYKQQPSRYTTMKFSYSVLLISAAIATIVSAAPLPAQVSTHSISKRCAECTQDDGAAFDRVVETFATHYSKIAHARLDGLMVEIQTTQVTSGAGALPQANAALTLTVQSNIERAKSDCTSEALAPAIRAAIASDINMDIRWSQKAEVEKKMADLDAKATALLLETLRANINAESLSTDCTERMTNTELAPAPVLAEMPATETLAATDSSVENKGSLIAGIDIASDADSKFVCKSGCQDSQDAESVLGLRQNLEREFTPRLEHFYNEEVLTECTERRGELLGGVFIVLDGLLGINLDINLGGIHLGL